MSRKKAYNTALAVCALAVVSVFGATVFMKMPGSGAADKMKPFTTMPIAHRGYYDNESSAPENSLAAFQRAIDYGYAIELDVQMTADGKLVVFHDKGAKRVCGIKRNIQDMTADELAQCRLFKSEEAIPTFRETLDLVNGKCPLLIEIKSDITGNPNELSAAVAELLDSYDGVYAVQSFDPLSMQWFRQNRPDIPRGLISRDFIANGKGKSFLERVWYTGMYGNMLSRPNFISYDIGGASQLTFSAMKSLSDLPCLAWTIGSQEELEKARSEGFDGFIFEGFEAKL